MKFERLICVECKRQTPHVAKDAFSSYECIHKDRHGHEVEHMQKDVKFMELRQTLREAMCSMDMVELLAISEDVERRLDYEARRMEQMQSVDQFTAMMKKQFGS